MNKPASGDKYKHFKGMVINVIAVGKNTETLEEMVVYEHDGDIWIRPLKMFMSKVDKNKYPDCKQEYRSKLKLKGKGVKIPNSLRKGDMYLIIKVIIPTKLDRSQKALVKELNDTDLNNETEIKKFNKYL